MKMQVSVCFVPRPRKMAQTQTVKLVSLRLLSGRINLVPDLSACGSEAVPTNNIPGTRHELPFLIDFANGILECHALFSATFPSSGLALDLDWRLITAYR